MCIINNQKDCDNCMQCMDCMDYYNQLDNE